MTVLRNTERRSEIESGAPDAQLSLNVILTEAGPTLACLGHAAQLAGSLSARIRLIAPSVVPRPLPPGEGPIDPEHQRLRLSRLAAMANVQAEIEIWYGRDTNEILRCALGPRSLVIIGGKRRWWPTPAQRCAKRLERAGHRVIFIDVEEFHA